MMDMNKANGSQVPDESRNKNNGTTTNAQARKQVNAPMKTEVAKGLSI
jgi:hypothetical protein